ncbi:MAG: hypothetical protein WCG25_03150 [bacterium]
MLACHDSKLGKCHIACSTVIFSFFCGTSRFLNLHHKIIDLLLTCGVS